MKSIILTITRCVGFLFTIYIWRIVLFAQFSQLTSLFIIIGTILLVFPAVWIGRKTVDIEPTIERLAWVTSVLHMVLMIFFGVSIIEAKSEDFFPLAGKAEKLNSSAKQRTHERNSICFFPFNFVHFP